MVVTGHLNGTLFYDLIGKGGRVKAVPVPDRGRVCHSRSVERNRSGDRAEFRTIKRARNNRNVRKRQSEVDAFYTSICRHTGDRGFEGFVVCLLQSATGQRFRIAASGQQDAHDASSEHGYGNRIYVETKHYQKPKLRFNDLNSSLTQAMNAPSGIDLWVLGASCAVSEQYEKKLCALAARQGVEILLLDNAPCDLPRLAVLMAEYWKAAQLWIENNLAYPRVDQLGTELNAMKTLAGYGTVLRQLRNKLAGTLLGYDDARLRIHQRLFEAVENRKNGMSRFNQDVGVRVRGERFVRRATIDQELSDWWATNAENGQSGCPRRPRR